MARRAASEYEAFELDDHWGALGAVTQKNRWNNMVEIEIGVMVNQCLDRRIADKPTLVSQIAAWERERRRNREGARIRWMLTVDRAREKTGCAYPLPTRGHAMAAA